MATIYIVEDDVNIREIERYALKNSGYQVEEFECGADLFKRLESKVPALILLDIMLPNEDGLDILTKIRADKNTAKVPIIMVTAKTSELDKVKGLDLGADDYISKPFGVMELISRKGSALNFGCECTFQNFFYIRTIIGQSEVNICKLFGNRVKHSRRRAKRAVFLIKLHIFLSFMFYSSIILGSAEKYYP